MSVADSSLPSQDSAGQPVAWGRWFIPAFLLILVSDLVSKDLIFRWYSLGEMPLPWIRPAINPGVAFSLFHDMPWLVGLMTLVLIPLLAGVWWISYRSAGALANLAFGLVLGGAIGNGVDRLGAQLGWVGGVRDFLHVDLGIWPLNPWPTFNIADSGICVGFAFLLILSFRRPMAPA